jgi:hypothetical protein
LTIEQVADKYGVDSCAYRDMKHFKREKILVEPTLEIHRTIGPGIEIINI